MTITAEMVKELRQKTGVGFMECKSALEEAGGDLETAITILRKKGHSSAARRAGRETREGLIGTYVHNGKVGVMVEVNCETDFVARNADFQSLVHDIAMQIAASEPRYVRREDVPEEIVAAERAIYKEQARAAGKPEGVLDKIADGRMAKFFTETCLMEQPFIKNPEITVADLVAGCVQRTGENIQVRRFVRYRVGE